MLSYNVFIFGNIVFSRFSKYFLPKELFSFLISVVSQIKFRLDFSVSDEGVWMVV